MKKNFFTEAATRFVAFVCVMVTVFGMTSCQQDGEWKNTEYAAPITKTEYKDRPVIVQNYINNYAWFVDNTVMVNGMKAMTFDVINTYPIIEMPVSKQGVPSMTGNTDRTWDWSDGQISKSSIETFGNDSLFISGTISPLYDEFKPVRLHEKVMKIDAFYRMEGAFNLSNRGLVNFSQKLNRPYYQVDPTVRVDTVTNKEIETQIEYVFKEIHDTTVVEKHDTTYVEVINNVEVVKHDTVEVEVIKEVEKEILREVFVQGAEINTNISNNWGYSNATMTLGENMLLNLSIRHSYNPITVADFGATLASGATATEWSFSDTQYTTSSSSTSNCTITGITWQKNETENIEGVGNLVTTIFLVEGYYVNENGDKKKFSFEMKPMYLQVKEAAPEPQVETKAQYRGIIRKISAEGLKLMTKPMVQQLIDGQWVDIRTASRVCVGLSGSPSGLDLFVKSRKVVEENEESHWYVATGDPDKDKQWIGEDSKTDGTVVYRNTKVYDFNYMFAADAVNNGLVGPQTQLYVMKAEKVTVLDPDGNALVCTWEDGSEFSLNVSVKLNDTKFVDDPALVGTTRTESDKTYKYETTFTQNFTASIGGKELQNVESKSPLWIPVE